MGAEAILPRIPPDRMALRDLGERVEAGRHDLGVDFELDARLGPDGNLSELRRRSFDGRDRSRDGCSSRPSWWLGSLRAHADALRGSDVGSLGRVHRRVRGKASLSVTAW